MESQVSYLCWYASYKNLLTCFKDIQFNNTKWFDPNAMYTSDKIVEKHISVILLKFDLEPKGQGHSKKQNNTQGNKNIPPLNKQSRDSLGNCCATDELNRLRMTYLHEQKKVNKSQE